MLVQALKRTTWKFSSKIRVYNILPLKQIFKNGVTHSQQHGFANLVDGYKSGLPNITDSTY